jgi:hypothetical protein
MQAVRPHIDEVAVGQVALLEGSAVGPLPGQPGDGGRGQAGCAAEELLQDGDEVRPTTRLCTGWLPPPVQRVSIRRAPSRTISSIGPPVAVEPSAFTTLSMGVPSRPGLQRGPTRRPSEDHSGRYAFRAPPRADPQVLSIAPCRPIGTSGSGMTVLPWERRGLGLRQAFEFGGRGRGRRAPEAGSAGSHTRQPPVVPMRVGRRVWMLGAGGTVNVCSWFGRRLSRAVPVTSRESVNVHRRH